MYKVLVRGVEKREPWRKTISIIINGMAEAVVFKVKLLKSKTFYL